MSGSEIPTPNDPFTLSSRDEILAKLRLLQLRQTRLTATAAGGNSGFTTSIVRIFSERDLLAFESDPTPLGTSKLLSAGSVTLSGRQDGVEVRFEVSEIREAILNGQELLAVSIPESLYWLQRRRYFRALIPYHMPIKCRVTFPDGESHWFDVLNLSIRGIALLDKSGLLRFWGRPGNVFEDCRLNLPGFANEPLDLEIRSKRINSQNDTPASTVRAGCAFHRVNPALETKIQRLLNELEIQARKERRHIDYQGP